MNTALIKNKSAFITVVTSLSLLACATPEKMKASAMQDKPLDVCNEYNVAVENNNSMGQNVLKNVIEERKINCQSYKNDLAILANQRFLRTLVGP